MTPGESQGDGWMGGFLLCQAQGLSTAASHPRIPLHPMSPLAALCLVPSLGMISLQVLCWNQEGNK